MRDSWKKQLARATGRGLRGFGRFLHLTLGGATPACRFEPTCSVYAETALENHGFWGFVLVISRVSRCHPWGGHGWDPVPGTAKEGCE